MAVAARELRRGRIFYATFPFASAFPLVLEDDSGRWVEVSAIETYAETRGGAPTRVAAEVRLRPILLLHDGTRGEYPDVICFRVNAVKARHRRDPAQWERIERREHPLFFHLPAHPARYGLVEDSLVSVASVGVIHKSAILGPRHIGELTTIEMEAISQRLARALSLDLSALVAARARELLRRAGFGGGPR